VSLDKRTVGKRIAVIGVSDEETAHLRLLMRKATDELSHEWKWGSESAADLLIVDPASFAGQMARTRAQAAGMRCAIFSDEPVPGEPLVLRRPLKFANVVAILNQAAETVERPEGIDSNERDAYFLDIGDETTDLDTLEMPEQESPPQPMREAAPGLEELLRIDPVDVKESARIKAALDENTTVFGTAGPTARSEARGRDIPDIFSRSRSEAPPQESVLVRRGGALDTSRHSLRVYLDSDVLGGPARITLPDAPPLVLDPKPKMFHSSGRLAALEPYCRTALRPSDWQTLTTTELAELRVAEPPQPYLRLIWLYVLVHSEGQLARNLDPGGTYRLVRWIEIERDFSAYFRIASTMLQPARLHQIAAASGASMADVFDVVNAYDAIGLIEWQPRAPRGGAPVEAAKPGLLGRLRKSLKRP
jgi:hypothetical protein